MILEALDPNSAQKKELSKIAEIATDVNFINNIEMHFGEGVGANMSSIEIDPFYAKIEAIA
jgi:hypothetical protein